MEPMVPDLVDCREQILVAVKFKKMAPQKSNKECMIFAGFSESVVKSKAMQMRFHREFAKYSDDDPSKKRLSMQLQSIKSWTSRMAHSKLRTFKVLTRLCDTA
ncbi:MAG: hypothetical protein ACRDL7_04360 [Gaiellaceae bacterium]